MSRPPGVEINVAWLKAYRMSLRMTQAEMAAYLGISESHYRGVEAGSRLPSYSLWMKIAETDTMTDVH